MCLTFIMVGANFLLLLFFFKKNPVMCDHSLWRRGIEDDRDVPDQDI